MSKSVFVICLSRFLCLAFGDDYVKMNEDTPILLATKMFTRDSGLWQYKVYLDMCCSFRMRRHQLTADAVFVKLHVSVAM